MDPGAVTTADLRYHVLAAMGTPVLNLHVKQVEVCQDKGIVVLCCYRGTRSASMLL